MEVLKHSSAFLLSSNWSLDIPVAFKNPYFVMRLAGKSFSSDNVQRFFVKVQRWKVYDKEVSKRKS